MPRPTRSSVRRLALASVAGTIVIGSGPLAGTTIDSHGRRSAVPRFPFPPQDVTQMHADVGWFLGALVVALVIGMQDWAVPSTCPVDP